eukprot:8526374-Pyramimonas_sp.AAC.1
MADINDGVMGISRQRDSWVPVASPAVGLTKTQGRMEVGAGHKFRELVEKHGMYSVSSSLPFAPTFFGAGDSCSLIDHIAWPLALADTTRSA